MGGGQPLMMLVDGEGSKIKKRYFWMGVAWKDVSEKNENIRLAKSNRISE
jgi:hypothetical protein